MGTLTERPPAHRIYACIQGRRTSCCRRQLLSVAAWLLPQEVEEFMSFYEPLFYAAQVDMVGACADGLDSHV